MSDNETTIKAKASRGLVCSFCGKTTKEVKKLIMGPDVGICNECVSLTVDIIRDELDPNFAINLRNTTKEIKGVKCNLSIDLVTRQFVWVHRSRHKLDEVIPEEKKDDESNI